MKLTYTTDPTETMIITSPLGTQHRIPVWTPVGERGEPVLIELAPGAPKAVNHVRLKERICDYFKTHDPGDRGLTHWQIADALGENRQTVGRSLLENKTMFRRSSNVVLVSYKAGINRGERKLALNLWHLRKDEN